MQAPAIPFDEASRLAVLRALQVLDTPAEERFERHTRLARRLFGVPIALVSLVDTNRQWFKSVQGLVATHTPRDISFCGHVVANQEALVVENALDDPRFSDNPLVAEDPSIRFYAGAPLEVSGKIMGTICVIDRVPRQMDAEERACLADLADMVVAELKSLTQATTDTLTGLCNRRGLTNVVRHLQSADRASQGGLGPVSALLIDMDGFKAINDTWGHQAGDEALVAMSDLMGEVFDASDWVARLGGDEFCVLSSDRSPADVLERVTALSEAVVAFNEKNDAPWDLAYSSGAAHAARMGGLCLEDLLDEADELMYADKRARRAARSAAAARAQEAACPSSPGTARRRRR